MTIEQAVLENLRELPADKQQEVLDFIQFIKHKLPTKKCRIPPSSIAGKGKTLGDIVSPIVLISKDNPWQSLIDSLDQFSDDFMNTRDQLSIDKREEF
jgi:hypothetical protein